MVPVPEVWCEEGVAARGAAAAESGVLPVNPVHLKASYLVAKASMQAGLALVSEGFVVEKVRQMGGGLAGIVSGLRFPPEASAEDYVFFGRPPGGPAYRLRGMR